MCTNVFVNKKNLLLMSGLVDTKGDNCEEHKIILSYLTGLSSETVNKKISFCSLCTHICLSM